MRTGIFAALSGLAIAALAGSSAFAASGITNKALNGNYVVSWNGFMTDNNADEGEMLVNGVLVFNGVGGIQTTANGSDLTFVAADDSSPADNIICQPTITGGNYSLNSDGTGTLNLSFSSTNTDCFGDNGGGTLDFFITVGRSGSALNQAVLTDFTNLTLLDTNEEILSLVLQGSFQKQ